MTVEVIDLSYISYDIWVIFFLDTGAHPDTGGQNYIAILPASAVRVAFWFGENGPYIDGSYFIKKKIVGTFIFDAPHQ